jgi:hypothetical protein
MDRLQSKTCVRCAAPRCDRSVLEAKGPEKEYKKRTGTGRGELAQFNWEERRPWVKQAVN